MLTAYCVALQPLVRGLSLIIKCLYHCSDKVNHYVDEYWISLFIFLNLWHNPFNLNNLSLYQTEFYHKWFTNRVLPHR